MQEAIILLHVSPLEEFWLPIALQIVKKLNNEPQMGRMQEFENSS